MKIGLIGAGRWAEVHKEALESLGHKVSAVLVSTEPSRERIRQEWGIEPSLNLQDFLGYGVEAVIVVSPNYLHGRHGMAALNAGKHVLVEKPMALSLRECDTMLAAAKQANKVLAIGLEMRVFALFAKVKTLIEQGDIGKPISLHLDLWRRPYREGAGGWKNDPEKLGSSILEEPIHYLDLARWYLLESSGEPSELLAWSTSREGRSAMHENLDIKLSYQDGTRALISRSIAAYEHSVYLRIVGEKGSLRASWEGKEDLDLAPKVRLKLHNSGDRDASAQDIPVEQKSGHAYDVPKQTKAFLSAITSQTPPAASGEDGRAAVALSLAADVSLLRKSKVEL